MNPISNDTNDRNDIQQNTIENASLEVATLSTSGISVNGSTIAPEPITRSLFDSRTSISNENNQTNSISQTNSNRENCEEKEKTKSFAKVVAEIKQHTQTINTTSSNVAPINPQTINRDEATIVYVNRCQTGNPLLKNVKNVSLEFRDGLVPDYVMGSEGTCTCVLFLSIRYHLLHPMYLEERMNRIRNAVPSTPYRTKVILCYIDISDNETPLQDINRIALLSGYTLIVTWSWLEAARYLETLKSYEFKSAGLIKERVESEYLPKVNDVFTTIRSVNKTDVITLLSAFGSVKGVMNAPVEELSLCPGLGATKVRHLLEAFHEPFSLEQ